MSFDVALTSCPTCRSGCLALQEGASSFLLCESCSDGFPLIDGVGCFVRNLDDYWENYDEICSDDLEEAKTPSVVKDRYSAFIAKRVRGTVCDLGCGDGEIVERLVSGHLRIAVDIARPYLVRLADPIMKIWSEIENVPLRDGTVDTVVCANVLEHVRDAERLASEIDRLVSSDGRILLSFPFEQDLGVYELEEYKAKYQKYKYVHLRSITDDLIARLFPDYEIVGKELITDGMELMEFKPYPVKAIELVRR